MELKNAKYQFRVENTESKIQHLRCIRSNFYKRLKLSQLRSVLIFYALWKHQKTTDLLCFQRAQKGILTRNELNNNNIGKGGII